MKNRFTKLPKNGVREQASATLNRVYVVDFNNPKAPAALVRVLLRNAKRRHPGRRSIVVGIVKWPSESL